MEVPVIVVAALACPVAMGLMMFLMARGMKGQGTSKEVAPCDVTELRAEQERIGAEIARLEQRQHLDREGAPAS